MRPASLRIPYRNKFPVPRIIPSSATTLPSAITALKNFLTAPPGPGLPSSTVILTGAGLSTSSGLADYRGPNGTYLVNKTYRPIYYTEFLASHAARRRYWARSFLGWTSLAGAQPNAGHYAIRELGELGLVNGIVTQNVDSFHRLAHEDLPTTELHGYLRTARCVSCGDEMDRHSLQKELAKLNPAWDAFLAQALEDGEDTINGMMENKAGLASRGIKSNPDGDMEVPDAPYQTFRYPPCPTCSKGGKHDHKGNKVDIHTDVDGAWLESSTGGVLKPAVVQFGENITDAIKDEAQARIDNAGRLLVLGTSLATYSAWRLAKSAKDRGMPVAIVNMGGVRDEGYFFTGVSDTQNGAEGVRVEAPLQELLPGLVEVLKRERNHTSHTTGAMGGMPLGNNGKLFKEMLS